MLKHARFSLQGKLLFTYVLVLFTPFLFAVLIFGMKSYEEVKNSHADFMFQLIKQTNRGIDNFFVTANRITLMNAIDSEVAKILKKRDKQPRTEYLEDLRIIRIAIDHAIYLNPGMSRVTFIGMNGSVYSNDGVEKAYIEHLKPWYMATEKSMHDTLITPVYDGVYFHNPTKLISIVRMLKFLGMKIGYVNVDINFTAILNILGANSDDYVGTLLIEGNKILYDSFNESNEDSNYYGELINLLKSNLIENKDSVVEYKINGVRYLIAANYNDTTNWIIAKYIPVDVIGDSFKKKLGFYFGILLISLIFAFVCAYVFSVRIIKPISKMRKSMKLVEMGKLNLIEEDQDRSDEISDLVQSYNTMIGRLNESIQKEYLADIHQKKIEFQMLQAQINPHFLYNTLNVISSMAEINGVDEISDITNKLSRMFRYNISQKDFVRVGEEIEQINNYIGIQKARFPGKIHVAYDIEEPIYDYSIMKFSLQPFVENAIYHGIEPKGGKGSLFIRIRLQQDDIIITIQDDGVGMPESRLSELNRSLMETRSPFQQGRESLGIKNVHFRIKATYGVHYGIRIESVINKGTTVQIKMPAIKTGGSHENLDCG